MDDRPEAPRPLACDDTRPALNDHAILPAMNAGTGEVLQPVTKKRGKLLGDKPHRRSRHMSCSTPEVSRTLPEARQAMDEDAPPSS